MFFYGHIDILKARNHYKDALQIHLIPRIFHANFIQNSFHFHLWQQQITKILFHLN